MTTSRVSALTLVAAAALALSAPAAGKEPTRVTVCGHGDDCVAISDPERLSLVPVGGELESTYRVIPDDALADAQPSSAARPARQSRNEEGSAFWLSAAIALGLGAAALLLRRLPPHEARDQRAEALAVEHTADALGDR